MKDAHPPIHPTRSGPWAPCASLVDLAGQREGERLLAEFMAQPRDTRLPRDLGGYRLMEERRRCGRGITYAAVHRESRRRAAVTLLRSRGTEHARARLRQEAMTLARIRHPNLVRFLELGETDGQLLYATSMVDGLGLAPLPVDAGRRAQHAIARGLAAVADALHRLHEAGLVHRDVSPGVIVLAGRRRPVLVDHGLAADDDVLRLTRTDDRLGGPAYMAPEQIPGHGMDARTDIYGLGATLYYVLAGRPPFESNDGHALATAVLEQRPEAPSAFRRSIPHLLECIALKALEKQRADRYADAADMRDALLAYAKGPA